ncbi:uncharacterized protein CcaverHIS019_0100330 [Cutaneotrichosporon cavernicola]|uniref:Uncharacterized protein n=1 Tax=Cutaneotrichosporon cavernicola TaxID=279322 RepID=A0AA48I5B4_9TREE|nr:uncharacterized protein CcaverHIS019_0100330 [Cutaneotrichosporon cavernicola]BEI87315.1 hypothetical protein CcaverHIS019_0100330 [Cutaneotrichosporon cavernicola]
MTSDAKVISRTPKPSATDPVAPTTTKPTKPKRDTSTKAQSKNRANSSTSSGSKKKTKTGPSTIASTTQISAPSPLPNTQPIPPIPSLPSSLPSTQTQALRPFPPLSIATSSDWPALTTVLADHGSEGTTNRITKRYESTANDLRPKLVQLASKTSVKRKTIVVTPSRPAIRATKKFVPLTCSTVRHVSQSFSAGSAGPQSIPREKKPQLFTLPADANRSDRVKHIQSHFLDRLFLNLNQARDTHQAVASVPAALPTLAFSGLHGELYDGDLDAFQVALRWWIARLHTTLQLGSAQEWSAAAGGRGLLGPDMTLWPAVAECKKVVEGIYLVVTASQKLQNKDKVSSRSRDPPSTEPQGVTCGRYLVLASTGDVIATDAPSSATTEPLTIEGCLVRSDWHSYILNLVSSPTETPRSCVPNSYSGEKLSAMHMDAEWICNTADLNSSSTRSKTSFFALASHAGSQKTAKESPIPVKAGATNWSKVELYLPESQQVLSVHLPGAPTAPALAIVHRASGKSDWVLRETGHVVGNEDEGVAELWQGILGCDRHGAEADVDGFWNGWQTRVRGDEWECACRSLC